MICRFCKREVSEDEIFCKYCGRDLKVRKNKNSAMRKKIGIADFLISAFFIFLIIKYGSGFDKNTRIIAMCWFLLWCGILNFFGKRNKIATIISLVFYVAGILYNFSCGILYYPAHFIISFIMAVFFALIAIGINDKNSFKHRKDSIRLP